MDVEGKDAALKALAQGLVAPVFEWLESVDITPARFTEVMRGECSFNEKPEALGITEVEFKQGIDSIPSLPLYAVIMGVPVEQLWLKIEANAVVAPQWLIDQLEDVVGDKLD